MVYKLAICLSVMSLMTFQVSFSQRGDALHMVQQELLSKLDQFDKVTELKKKVVMDFADLTINIQYLNRVRDSGVNNRTLIVSARNEIGALIPESLYYMLYQEKDLADMRLTFRQMILAQQELEKL